MVVMELAIIFLSMISSYFMEDIIKVEIEISIHKLYHFK